MDDFDFSHLMPVGTARYTLAGVGIPRSNPTDLVLIGQHAGPSNERFSRTYKNAAMRGKVDVRAFVEVFAKTVLTGWENALDASGAPIPFSPDLAAKLLRALLDAKRDDLVGGAFTFFSDADHFCETRDGSDLGKE